MASLRVLAFDHEGRPVQFDTWLNDLQLYLLSDSKDSVSLFDLVLGAATAPPATADTQALYDAVVARYSSPATTALGRLLLPDLFPKLSAFATIKDLVSHLRASDARYCAAVLASSLTGTRPRWTTFSLLTPPPSVSLEKHLLAAETSAVAFVGATLRFAFGLLSVCVHVCVHGMVLLVALRARPSLRGAPPPPLPPATAAHVFVPEDVGAASASGGRGSKGKGGRGGGGGSGGGGGGSGSGGGGSSGGGGGCGSGG
ncbi:unnamed protein product [Closterium sp. NIES-53]